MTPFFEFDFGKEGGKRSFATIEDVSNFLETEKNAWKWLDTLAQNSAVARDARNVSDQCFNDIGNHIQQLRSYPAHTNENLSAAFHRAFANKIPLIGSKKYKYISALREDDAVLAASTAAAFFGATSGNVPTEGLRGAVHAVCFDLGVNPRSAQAVQQELSSWSERFGEAHHNAVQARDDLVAKTATVEANFAKAEGERKRRELILSRWSDRNTRKHTAQKNKEIAQAIAELKEVERSYRETMRLKAPVEYWENKRDEHKNEATRRAKHLLWFAAIAGVGVSALFVGAALNAEKFISASTPLPVVGIWTALGVFVTSIAFWAGRILTRLYLSELHLGIDAQERAVMAQTYLALTAEGTVSEEQRTLVLAGLFRGTSDGIVRDDAAPDLGIAALVSRLASR